VKDFKPTFIAWYETDFRADRVVQRMTSVQRAFYRNLLIESYYNELRPNLPADDEKLWLLADADSLDHWLANKPLILTKFNKGTDSDGVAILWNKRVYEEWGELLKRLQQKSNAGAASARSRMEKRNIPQPTPTSVEQPLTSVEQPLPDSAEPNRTAPNSTVHKSVEQRSADVNTRSTSVAPSPFILPERADEEGDQVVEIASGFDRRVMFMPKNKAAIARIVRDFQPTKDELSHVLREMVQVMSDKDVAFAGSIIEGGLKGKLSEFRKTMKRNKDRAEAQAKWDAEPDDMFPAPLPARKQTAEEMAAI
jgi:uncharacterized protein YdaU (DUF1376 family)